MAPLGLRVVIVRERSRGFSHRMKSTWSLTLFWPELLGSNLFDYSFKVVNEDLEAILISCAEAYASCSASGLLACFTRIRKWLNIEMLVL